MKKLLLSAFAALACVSFAQAEEITLDFTTNAYGQTTAGTGNDKYYMPDGTTFYDGAINITVNKNDGSGVRFWKADKGDQTFRINNKSGFTISIEGGTISAFKITGYDLGYLSGTGYNNGEWSGSESSITLTNTGNNGKTTTVKLKTLTVTYTGGVADTRADADMAFSAETAIGYVGEEFTAPTLTKATTAVVSYASDKETVATVDATTGAVTIVGTGTARITASAPANDDFRAGSASYLLTVRPAKVANAVFTSEMGEGFSFENPADIAVWSVDSKYGLKASAYVDKAAHATEAIAYTTEAIDLTGKKGATLTFHQAMNQFKNGEEMIDVDAIIDYCKLLVREEGATAWTEIGEPTAPEAFSWNFYANAPVDLSAYDGKKIQIGFKYISTANVAGTWEIQTINVAAEADEEDSISEINAAAASGAIYDLQGRRVVAPSKGLYIVNGKVVRY